MRKLGIKPGRRLGAALKPAHAEKIRVHVIRPEVQLLKVLGQAWRVAVLQVPRTRGGSRPGSLRHYLHASLRSWVAVSDPDRTAWRALQNGLRERLAAARRHRAGRPRQDWLPSNPDQLIEVVADVVQLHSRLTSVAIGRRYGWTAHRAGRGDETDCPMVGRLMRFADGLKIAGLTQKPTIV
jgi:hypothetical protein